MPKRKEDAMGVFVVRAFGFTRSRGKNAMLIVIKDKVSQEEPAKSFFVGVSCMVFQPTAAHSSKHRSMKHQQTSFRYRHYQGIISETISWTIKEQHHQDLHFLPSNPPFFSA